MTSEILGILNDIVLAKQKLDQAKFHLRQAQERCPHTNKQSWTNNDGDGQFTVERCVDCGIQKDGGL